MKPRSLSHLSFAILTALLASQNLAKAEDYYQKTKGYRSEPEPDPGSYVRNLSKTQFKEFRDVDWLDVGLDFRTRYEYRENDYRPYTSTATGAPVSKFRSNEDDVFLLRTRAYFGVKNILDPLRFAVEFQDSRSYNSQYERVSNDVNEFDLLQGYGELYFDNALGHNRPISLRAGRQSFELLDRRLIANNQFRNTSNNFEGYRLRFGKKQNDWDLDTFALQPVERLKYEFDRPDERTWVYGAVLSLKQWSDVATIQPYFLGKRVKGNVNYFDPTFQTNSADIYSPGLRVYGVIPDTGWDFDADINKQFGTVGSGKKGTGKDVVETTQQVSALAYSLEAGYTFDHDWKPRASAYYGYGSGDKNPADGINQNFDSFYGFNQPWSRNDYFTWTNVKAPKVRIEFSPYKDVNIDAGYSAFWLDSETAAWSRAGLQDRNGKSGSFLGQEFDIRLRHKLNAYVDWTASYGRFEPGGFTLSQAKATGPYTSEASNFFYFEVSVNAFGDGKPTY